MKPTRHQLQLDEWRRRRQAMVALREDGHTLEEIAKMYNITRERVRQLLINARAAA